MAYIEIHPDFKTAFSAIEDQFPGFEQQLKDDFLRFIKSGRNEFPVYFGRDSIYNWPYQAQREAVSHMHIALPPREFSRSKGLDDRKNPQQPDLDACLVYCEHAVTQGRILFMDFFYPDAHQMAKNERRMKHLAQQAEEFHDDW